MIFGNRINKNGYAWIGIVGVLIYAWLVLYVQQGELLYAIHNFSPCDASFYHPGGVREWVGEWLTQLCHYPILGASVYVMLWGMSALFFNFAFGLKGYWLLWPMIAVLSLLASITDLGYWLFCLKAPSYWMGPTFGMFCTAFLVWTSTKFSEVSNKMAWAIPGLYLLLFMPLLGWYGTVVALLILLLPSLKRPLKVWVLSVVALLMSVLLLVGIFAHSSTVHWREPLLWYGWHRLQNPEAGSTLLEMPFWIMACSLMLLPVVSRLQHFH
ncbi:MAG: DUF6057 family protein, partial [Bacteroidales bacterium]|nr:DUF6057 family protein [Bacteroidales bacterium]